MGAPVLSAEICCGPTGRPPDFQADDPTLCGSVSVGLVLGGTRTMEIRPGGGETVWVTSFAQMCHPLVPA